MLTHTLETHQLLLFVIAVLVIAIVLLVAYHFTEVRKYQVQLKLAKMEVMSLMIRKSIPAVAPDGDPFTTYKAWADETFGVRDADETTNVVELHH